VRIDPYDRYREVSYCPESGRHRCITATAFGRSPHDHGWFISLLAGSEHPLRAREIQAAAETFAGEPLSWNTVKDCLHKNARRPDSPIERVSHCRYRHL